MCLELVENSLVVNLKQTEFIVNLNSHYRHEHVFTRLICLFVKQMVSICLRGRLLLLLC